MPLVILAMLSIATGYMGIPHFLAPALERGAASAHPDNLWIMAIATLITLSGIGSAYLLYVARPELPDWFARHWASLYAGSLNKWYVDELYDAVFVKPTLEAARDLWNWVDVRIIDAAVNGTATTIRIGSGALRIIQSGQVQHYALGMAIGAVVMLGVYLLL